MSRTGDRVWVPHPSLGFVACFPGSGPGNYVTESGENLTVPAAEVDTLERVFEDQLSGIDDVSKLNEVSLPAVLNTVRVRYLEQLIYTRVSRIVIAVNPFQPLPIYSAQILAKYTRAADSMDLDPHVFGIGLDAVSGLRQSGANQAVLISGESGSGKSETTKLVLSYVAGALHGGSACQGIEDKIQQSLPVLEAFGNSMTVRNNNSSRFGKWIEISVSKTLEMTGCQIEDYLLEVSRVCAPGKDERNYHIFYQVIHGRNSAELKPLGIKEPQHYNYLRGAQFQAPGIDDGRCFDELKEAFATLNFDQTAQLEIFKVVGGILALGNCDFRAEEKSGGEAAAVENQKSVQETAKLLELKAEDIEQILVVRKIKVGREVTETPMKLAQAKAARDGLCKLLYGLLFKLLVVRINQVLAVGAPKQVGQFFGVLDIAGFESFAVNSLEQLFINLSNEHLQQHFNNFVFKMELADYEAEGVSLGGAVDFEDNEDVLALIAGDGGLLPMLDEELSIPKATDQTYVSKVVKKYTAHRRFAPPKFGNNQFGVRHFAGEVVYSASGFLDKNVNKPPDDVPELLSSSKLGVVAEIGELAAGGAEVAGRATLKRSGTAAAKPKTVAAGFRISLTQLVKKLQMAEPHFIRCVKPNAEKVPNSFSADIVRDQLTLSGVMSAVKIRQQGYATRVPFDRFLHRFGCILPKSQRRKLAAAPDTASRAQMLHQALPKALAVTGGCSLEDFALGKSKMFCKSYASMCLEKARDLALAGFAVDIERHWRGRQVRQMLKSCHVVFADVEAWVRRNKLYAKPGSEHTALAKLKTADAIDAERKLLEAVLAKAEKLPVTLPGKASIKKVQSRMLSEAALLREMAGLTDKTDPLVLTRAIARATSLEMPMVAEVQVLEDRRAKLAVQIPLVTAMTKALEGKGDQAMLEAALGEARKQGLNSKPELWVTGLQGEELSAKVFAAIEQLKSKSKEKQMVMKKKLSQPNLDVSLRSSKRDRTTSSFKDRLESSANSVEPLKDGAVSGGAAGKRRSTLTGLDSEGQQKLLMSIAGATHELDAEALEKALGEATAQGMDPKDVADGHSVFAKLQAEDFLADMITVRVDMVKGVESPEAHDLKVLQNLLAQARRLGVAEEAVRSADNAMRKGVRRRASQLTRGSIFDQVDVSELQLAEAAFHDLSRFSGLKSAKDWTGHHRGHQRWGWLARRNCNMLEHGLGEISEALSKVGTSNEAAAKENFKNILGWMQDRPVPDCQRLCYAQTIVDSAGKSALLGDEVYLQLMKQLTENPSQRSCLLGWKLMLSLCQQVRPGTELADFVRAFLIRSLQAVSLQGLDVSQSCQAVSLQGLEDQVEVIKQSIVGFNLTASAAAEEGAHDTMKVQIWLMDHSTRRITISRSDTLEDLRNAAGEDMKISEFEDFSFFQLIDGLAHRLLPDHLRVMDIMKKWQKLKQSTGRASYLLWKRRSIRVDEMLQAGDLMHATLTYRQALWDYLKYPVLEDETLIASIAGTILWAEASQYERTIADGKLGDDGILEHLMPEHMLKQQKRTKWVKDILKNFVTNQEELGDEDTRLQKMARIMTMMQKMKLFGAYYWLGRQIREVAPDKAPIPDAPEAILSINPKEPEDDYWICVDPRCIRFVTVDSRLGKQFQRAFWFDEEAMERVLSWGAKAHVLAFIIQTIDPKLPAAQRVPMTIALESPVAMDVAHAARCLLQEGALQVRKSRSRQVGGSFAPRSFAPAGRSFAPNQSFAPGR